jgi:hypothetical protein
VTVVIGARKASFAMPQAWPPPPAIALVARASRVLRALHTLVIHDTFGAGHASLNTVFRIGPRPAHHVVHVAVTLYHGLQR